MKLSAVVLTKNEEKNIKQCLTSLSFCDEVIVIDDNSQDQTVEIAKRRGTLIFIRSLDADFSSQRNFGLEKAKGDWVLFVDADERVSKNLRREILRVISSQISLERNLRGFYVKRQDSMWGRELCYGETANVKLLRLARKDVGRWDGKVHERWVVKGKISELKNPLLHYPHQNIKDFLVEINYYTDIRASELFMQGIQVYWLSIMIYPVGKFLFNYFFKLGFLDGMPGLIVAVMMSLHSFLVRGKLWLLWQKK